MTASNYVFAWGVFIGAIIFGPVGFLMAAVVAVSGRQSEMEEDAYGDVVNPAALKPAGE